LCRTACSFAATATTNTTTTTTTALIVAVAACVVVVVPISIAYSNTRATYNPASEFDWLTSPPAVGGLRTQRCSCSERPRWRRSLDSLYGIASLECAFACLYHRRLRCCSLVVFSRRYVRIEGRLINAALLALSTDWPRRERERERAREREPMRIARSRERERESE